MAPLPSKDPDLRDLSLGAGTVNDDLFVTYRSPDFQGGAVAVFTNNGKFLGQIACDTTEGGNLQSPWGLAFIKQGIGEFSGDSSDTAIDPVSDEAIPAPTAQENLAAARAQFLAAAEGVAHGGDPGKSIVHEGGHAALLAAQGRLRHGDTLQALGRRLWAAAQNIRLR